MPAPAAAAATAQFPSAEHAPWWRDPRFTVPAVFVGVTAAGVLLFSGVHAILKQRDGATGPPSERPLRDDLGFVFPERGYVLCPQGAGLPATEKPVTVGDFVVLWLGDPKGEFVEPTWGRVLRIDAEDPNRIFVIIAGEQTSVGQRALQTARHGFNLSQAFWMTRDCIVDVLLPLADERGMLLCGGTLVTFDGPDDDFAPDGYRPARLPDIPHRLVGRHVELLLVSKDGAGSAWQVPVVAQIVGVGPSGHIATVRVTDVGTDPVADDPLTGHSVRTGHQFDIVWDCVTTYRS